MSRRSVSWTVVGLRIVTLATLALLASRLAAAEVIGLPAGDLFAPLLADPKEPRFVVSVLGPRALVSPELALGRRVAATFRRSPLTTTLVIPAKRAYASASRNPI